MYEIKIIKINADEYIINFDLPRKFLTTKLEISIIEGNIAMEYRSIFCSEKLNTAKYNNKFKKTNNLNLSEIISLLLVKNIKLIMNIIIVTGDNFNPKITK